MAVAKQIVKNLYHDVVPKIGLEVHAQLNINSKLFSRAANLSTAPPNTQLDLLDISLPGSLPKLNKNAIESAILTSLGLNCEPQTTIHFDRKNYFYSDMPAGYQITQYNKPIARNGHLDFIVTTYHAQSLAAHSRNYDMIKHIYANRRNYLEVLEPYVKRTHIKQIQLEQDSAKTLQQTASDGSYSEQYSLIDYNRSGTALIEIVFEPDLENHHEASSSINELVLILKSLGTCDCEFQEGSIRVDANISISSVLDRDLKNSARVELKNLNSLKSLNRGIFYEIKRQGEIIKSGNLVVQETRTFDTKTGKTVPLRLKEEAVDYRYVPEPNIPPLQLDQEMIQRIKEVPVDLPSGEREVLRRKYNLGLSLISELLDEPGLDKYYDEVMSGKCSYDANLVADFLVYTISNLKDALEPQVSIDLSEDGILRKKLDSKRMQELLDMTLRDEISFSAAYDVAKYVIVNDTRLKTNEIVKHLDCHQINDENQIEDICVEAVRLMKNISKQYKKKGEKRHLRMMIDKLCETTQNKINVRKAIVCLDKLLKPSNNNQ